MNIKLIATDMDGTFLDDHKVAPEENIRAFALDSADFRAYRLSNMLL